MFKIYKITNLINGNIYIGYTKQTLQSRFNQHSRSSKMVISRAIKKYGINNFKIELMHEFDAKFDATQKEIELIEQLKPVYNVHQGGTGGAMHGQLNGMAGKEHTDEWKLNKSLQMTGENNPMFGKSHNTKTRQKISDSKKGMHSHLKGSKLTELHKDKLRQPKSEEHKQKLRFTYFVDDVIVYNAKQYCIEQCYNYIRFTQAAKKGKPYKGHIVRIAT